MTKWLVLAMMRSVDASACCIHDEPSILASGICTAFSAFKPHSHVHVSELPAQSFTVRREKLEHRNNVRTKPTKQELFFFFRTLKTSAPRCHSRCSASTLENIQRSALTTVVLCTCDVTGNTFNALR